MVTIHQKLVCNFKQAHYATSQQELIYYFIETRDSVNFTNIENTLLILMLSFQHFVYVR